MSRQAKSKIMVMHFFSWVEGGGGWGGWINKVHYSLCEGLGTPMWRMWCQAKTLFRNGWCALGSYEFTKFSVFEHLLSVPPNLQGIVNKRKDIARGKRFYTSYRQSDKTDVQISTEYKFMRTAAWFVLLIHHFHIDLNAPCLLPKILHNHYLRFLLGPRRNWKQWLRKILGSQISLLTLSSIAIEGG